MRAPVGYGIDFGTSNSSIAIAYDEGPVEVLQVATGDMPNSLPSISYLHRDGNRSAGEQAINEYLITGSNRTACDRCSLVVPDLNGRRYSACNQFAPGGSCNDTRLIYGLKSELSNDTFTRTHSWATDFHMADLVSIILRDLKRRADAHSRERVDRVLLGVPVAFLGTEGDRFDQLQQLAEERLIESAYETGFVEVDLFPEPAAAVMDQPLASGLAVALDFGGGTFDVAVIEMPESGGGAEVIGLQGAAVGGSEFDALIFDFAVADAVGVDGRLPTQYREQMRTLMGVRSLLSDKNLRGVLASVKRDGARTEAIVEILFGGQAYAFYKTIEDAKIQLSVDETAEIRFTRPGMRINRSITRSEFEGLIAPHLGAVERAIANALDEAGVNSDNIHTVVRTGGSSEIPAFLRLVSENFPNAEVRQLPVFTAVAQGLGFAAQTRWRND